MGGLGEGSDQALIADKKILCERAIAIEKGVFDQFEGTGNDYRASEWWFVALCRIPSLTLAHSQRFARSSSTSRISRTLLCEMKLCGASYLLRGWRR